MPARAASSSRGWPIRSRSSASSATCRCRSTSSPSRARRTRSVWAEAGVARISHGPFPHRALMAHADGNGARGDRLGAAEASTIAARGPDFSTVLRNSCGADAQDQRDPQRLPDDREQMRPHIRARSAARAIIAIGEDKREDGRGKAARRIRACRSPSPQSRRSAPGANVTGIDMRLHFAHRRGLRADGQEERRRAADSSSRNRRRRGEEERPADRRRGQRRDAAVLDHLDEQRAGADPHDDAERPMPRASRTACRRTSRRSAPRRRGPR